MNVIINLLGSAFHEKITELVVENIDCENRIYCGSLRLSRIFCNR